MIIAFSLTACGGGGEKEGGAVPAKPFAERVVDDVVEAAQSPLEDVGLKSDPIPEKLQAIVEKPYVLPEPVTCEALVREVAELDTLLERDVDAPVTPILTGRDRYIQEGSDMAQGAASSFTMSKVGILPLRGVVRRVSGAEKHARAVTKAYQAGRLRRSYLKGVAHAKDCGKAS
jgi:hypothetical protein